MLTSLKSLIGSSKSATTIAGLSLVVATVGVAGAATLPDEANEEAKAQVEELEVPADDDADDRAEDARENDENGDTDEGQPEWLDDLHSFIESNDPSELGCEFGLGVAAIASQGNADLPEECGDGDEDVNSSDDVSTAGAENASNADDGLARASEESGQDVPAGGPDTADEVDTSPRGGPETGDAARGNAGPPGNDG